MRSLQDELDDASRHEKEPEQLHSPSEAKSWPLGRAIGIYLIFLFVTWGCIVPMIAPTDVAPPGAPPIPWYLITAQMNIGYGLPVVIAYLDYRNYQVDPEKVGVFSGENFL